MIRVRLEPQGAAYTLRMEGHAGYKPGEDIVCAACSAIAYSLLGWLREDKGHLRRLLEVRAEPGDLVLSAEGDGFVEEAFRQAAIGLQQVAQGYPGYVQVTGDWNFCGK